MAEEVSVKAGWLTPLLHAADIETSIRFYELLGFTTIDTDRATPVGWARLHCEGGALMFLRAEEDFKVSALPPYCSTCTRPICPRCGNGCLQTGSTRRRFGTPGTRAAAKSH